MSRQYTVRIGEREFAVTRTEDGALSVNGRVVEYRLDTLSDGQYILWIGPVPYRISRQEFSAEELERKLRVNGRLLSLLVEDERSALLSKFESASATTLKAAAIKAPMPGKIIKVLVSVGELIEAGQGVLLLEAMKMENELKAPASGIVRKIHVGEQATVEKNTLLIEIE